MVHFLFWGIGLIVFGLILYSKSLNNKDEYKKYLECERERYDELVKEGKDVSNMGYYTYSRWKEANCIVDEYFGFAIRFFFIYIGIYLILLCILCIFNKM